MIHVLKILFVVVAIPTGLTWACGTVRRWHRERKITRSDVVWGIAIPVVITAMGIFHGVGLINGRP